MELTDRVKEELVVARAQLHNEQAFEQLVRKYHPRLRYYISKMLKNSDMVDDVLQDAWTIIYRKLPKLKATKAFSVWIYRITYTETIRALRIENQYVELEEPDNIAESALQKNDDDFSDADICDLNLAIERLPETLRQAIVLKFLEEMSLEEISEITGAPVGTVKSRIHLAKKRLRNEMEVIRNERESI